MHGRPPPPACGHRRGIGFVPACEPRSGQAATGFPPDLCTAHRPESPDHGKRSMKYTPRPGWRGSGRRPPTRFARTNGQAARPGSNVPDSCIATAGRRSVDSGGGSVRMTQRERNRLCRKQSAEELREICLSPREIVAQSRVPDDAPTYAW